MKGRRLLGLLAALLVLAQAGCLDYCNRRYPCTAPAPCGGYAPNPCCQPAPACQPSFAPVQAPLQPIQAAPQGYYPYNNCPCAPATRQ